MSRALIGLIKVLSLNQVNWSNPIKIKSRQETIINLYRRLFGRERLPNDKSYWSMAGQCYFEGKYVDSEYDQVIKSGLVSPDQFNGVELNKDIHDANCNICGSNWHQGHFSEAVAANLSSNPGIVRHDDTTFPRTCVGDFAELMYVLEDTSDIMVTFTMAIKARGHKSSIYDLSSALSEHVLFMDTFYDGKWNFSKDCYVYISSIAGTEMATVYFWK